MVRSLKRRTASAAGKKGSDLSGSLRGRDPLKLMFRVWTQNALAVSAIRKQNFAMTRDQMPCNALSLIADHGGIAVI